MKNTAFLYILICGVFFSCSDLDTAEEQAIISENRLLSIENQEIEERLEDTQEYLASINNRVSEMLPGLEGKDAEAMTNLTYKLNKISEKINKLQTALKSKDGEIDNLNAANRKMLKEFDQLESLLAEKATSLQNLELVILDLEAEISLMAQELDSSAIHNYHLEQRVTYLSDELDKRFVLLGDRKSLQDQGVIERKGLPLFRQTKLGNDLSGAKDFTMISASTCSIPLQSNKATILSQHPETSYSIEQGADNKLTLNITDPGAFWAYSKVLIAETK